MREDSVKNWKENRALACVVLAAAILGGTFGIGGAKLSSAARSVNEAYAQNIAGDLALRAAAAQNIIAEGEAALGADAASVKTAKRAVEALEAFLATDDGANLLAGYKRASNILRAEEKKGPLPTGMVQTGLPGQPAEETALAFAAAAAATAVDAALETEDFAAAMSALARLRGPVDAFFTDHRVRVELDPTVLW